MSLRVSTIFTAAGVLVAGASILALTDLFAADSTTQAEPAEPTDPSQPSQIGTAPVQTFGPSQTVSTDPSVAARPQATCAADEPIAKTSADFDHGLLSAALSHEMVPAGAEDEIYAVLEFDTEAAPLDDRPPLNVALLIDRSGSMRGAPIEHARRAALGITERLGPQDVVSIATYDTRAEAVLPPTAVDEEGKDRIAEAIAGIDSRGMTNISEGLEVAYGQLAEADRDGALSRLIHLSDGKANRGMTSTPKMAELARQAAADGIRTTSVGLGVGYNETLMEALADAGRGGYYFVGNPSDLEPVFAGELEQLQATVATAAELRIEPMCDGVRAAEILGVPTEHDGDTLVASLADIAGGESRRFIVRLETTGLDAGVRGLVTASLHYDDPRSRQQVTTAVSLAATATPDRARADESVVEDVIAEVLEVQGAQAVHEAALAYRDGRVDEAQNRLRQQRATIEAEAERYKLSDELASRAGGRVGRFEADLEAARPGSPEASATALGGAAEARSATRKRTDKE